MNAARVALAAGSLSIALILGALGFQYLASMPPCEMCHWQRWPHIASAIIGIIGGALASTGKIDSRYAQSIAIAALVLIVAVAMVHHVQRQVEPANYREDC